MNLVKIIYEIIILESTFLISLIFHFFLFKYFYLNYNLIEISENLT